MYPPVSIRQILAALEREYPARGMQHAYQVRTMFFAESDPWTDANVERGGVPLPHTFEAALFDSEPQLEPAGPGEIRRVVHIPPATSAEGPGDLTAVAHRLWVDAVVAYYAQWRTPSSSPVAVPDDCVDLVADAVTAIRQVEVPRAVSAALNAAGIHAMDDDLLVEEGKVVIDVRATHADPLAPYDDWVTLRSDAFTDFWRGPAELVVRRLANGSPISGQMLIRELSKA
jgi:hypothetical protein